MQPPLRPPAGRIVADAKSPHPPERLIALLLVIAADVTFWAALLGAALVLRGGDSASFDGHRAETANSLYTWLVLPGALVAVLMAVPAVVRPGGRSLRIMALVGPVIPVAMLVLTLFIWSRPAAQLVELEIDGQMERFAVEVKPMVDPAGREGRFAFSAPDGWSPRHPVPARGVGDSMPETMVVTQGRVVAQETNGPGRHHFFGIAWIWAGALALHWVGGSLVAAFEPKLGLIWVGLCGLLSGGGLVALLV